VDFLGVFFNHNILKKKISYFSSVNYEERVKTYMYLLLQPKTCPAAKIGLANFFKFGWAIL